MRLAALMAALLVAGLLAACGEDEAPERSASNGGPAVKSDTAVFADYGGTTRSARGAAFFEPFSSQTGARVVSADADPAKMQLFAERGRAEWDLLDVDGWDLVRFSRAGLLRELPAEVTRTDLVPEEFRDVAAGGYTASVVIGHGTGEDAGAAPTTWADFWDTERFPGKRGLPSFPYMAVEAALLADGVPCAELYPLDFDRAFAKLDEIRDDTLFWDSFGQGAQFLAQGSVAMTLNTNSRITILRDQGLPVDLVWNDALLLPWTGMAVPKDAPHPDAAFALLDVMSQPEQQAQFARLTLYGPTNSKALDLLDEATLDRLPNSPEHAEMACQIDPVAASEQLDDYSERYTKWLAEG